MQKKRVRSDYLSLLPMQQRSRSCAEEGQSGRAEITDKHNGELQDDARSQQMRSMPTVSKTSKRNSSNNLEISTQSIIINIIRAKTRGMSTKGRITGVRKRPLTFSKDREKMPKCPGSKVTYLKPFISMSYATYSSLTRAICLT